MAKVVAFSATKSKAKSVSMPAMDSTYLLVLFALLVFGMIVLFSASSVKSFEGQGGAYSYVSRQLLWLLLGILAMFIMSLFDYHRLKKLITPAFVVWLGVMYATPFLGNKVGGATRWFLGIQPSELMKFIMIIMIAKILSDLTKGSVKSFRKGMLPVLVVLGLIAGSLILQKHLSALVITSAVAFAMLFVAGASLFPFFIMGTAGVAGMMALAIFEEYRWKRLTSFLDPFADPLDTGYHAIQGLYAIGSGSFFGLGLGQSRQKYSYIPEAQNDYIFAIACEELGFFGAFIIISLFVLLVWRGIHIAIKAPDMFGSLIAYGITILIGLQMCINIGVVTTMLPPTGMQLPFFSAGGSSLIFMLGGIGVLLNISRQRKR